jgi:PEP-CTERM motif-containing protein
MPPRGWRLGLIVSAFVLLNSPLHAAPVFIDFESLSDSEEIGGLLGPDVTFTNAINRTADITLNTENFPPQSGINAAVDYLGPMRLDFAAPISSFSAYFTYVMPLTLEFFDGSSNSLGVVTSNFDKNFVDVLDPNPPPNELLSGVFAGTAFITITGSEFGDSFVMDDVSFETMEEVTAVPEPSTLLLLVSGVAALGSRRKAFAT